MQEMYFVITVTILYKKNELHSLPSKYVSLYILSLFLFLAASIACSLINMGSYANFP